MLMKLNTAIVLTAALALSACSNGGTDFGSSTDSDAGVDAGSFEKFRAGIWIDGNGCDHWIIDDGIEGYMSPRLAKDGRPICREGSVPYSAIHFRRNLLGFKSPTTSHNKTF